MAKIASKMVVCGLVGLTDALQVNVATTTHERVPNPIKWVTGKFARKTETDESAAAPAKPEDGAGEEPSGGEGEAANPSSDAKSDGEQAETAEAAEAAAPAAPAAEAPAPEAAPASQAAGQAQTPEQPKANVEINAKEDGAGAKPKSKEDEDSASC